MSLHYEAVRHLRTGFLVVVLVISCSEQPDMVSNCATHADCPSGYTCDPAAGICVIEASCTVDNDCCPGLVCFNGGCRRLDECSADADCLADDRRCDGGTCIAVTCGDNSQCSGQANECVSGYCLPLPACGGCDSATVCEPVTGRCVPAPTTCATLNCGDNAVALVDNLAGIRGFGCDFANVSCQCAATPVPPQATPGPWLNLVRTGDDELTVVGHEMAAGQLVAQPFTDQGGGDVVVLDNALTAGSFASAGVVDGGIVAVARDGEGNRLRFVNESGAHTLDDTAGAGYGADLYVHPNGSLHVSYFVLGSDGIAALHYAHTQSSKPQSLQDWTTAPVHSGPLAPNVDVPCDGECALPEVCVRVDDAPTCALADILGTCEPRCSRSHVCVGGKCSLLMRRSAGLRPWDDAPGGDSAIAVRGDRVLIAYHDHRNGTVRWSTGPVGGTFSSTALAGGFGDDFGHHITVDSVDNGPIAVAFQDAGRQQIKLLYGTQEDALTPGFDEAGGKGIALKMRPDGTVVLAHGAADGASVRVVWGVPGNWTAYSPPFVDHVGRFNALVVDDNIAQVAVLIDRIDSRLRPAPAIEILTVLID